ncbi:MAG: hypothetical protein VYC34_11730, partial [Planctomycetota bacterium]|nr:hypothetical protein [Planctomycetota bacterium]
LLGLVVNANNITNVSFTGRGVTTSGGADSQPAVVQVSGGMVRMGWDVLRSGDGSAYDLFDDGVGSRPIASTAVLTDDSGAYTLHMTAPIAAFNGLSRFNAVGWPVIIIVELPTGERLAASSVLNKIGGGGALTFNPNNRRQENDGSASGATTFNINLDNVGVECLWNGWNLLKFARQSGYATAANQLPTLPNGIEMAEVASASTLSNTRPLQQFVYFEDDNEDGEWTADDDNFAGSFDSIMIDPNCFNHFAFTLTSRGVQVSSAFNGRFSTGITSVVGGYAVGFFNGHGGKLGVFQFGAPLTSSTIFSSAYVNNNLTLGWALVTYVPQGDTDTIAEFFTANSGADFAIEFNRTDHDEVSIRTSDDGSGDLDEVACQALFVHYER